MSWEQKTCDLEHPIKFDGKEYVRVTVRELNGNQIERLDDLLQEIIAQNPDAGSDARPEDLNMTARQALSLLKIAIVEPDGVVGEMHNEDLEKLGEVARPFIEKASSSNSGSSQGGGEQTET